MRRSILLAALLMAFSPAALAQPAKAEGTKPAASGTKTSKKPAPGAKANAAKSAAPKPSPASPASKASANAQKAAGGEERRTMLRMRSVFGYAAEACGEGRSRCDRELLDSSEQDFVNACRACDTVDRCEAERASIRAGNARTTPDLCGRP